MHTGLLLQTSSKEYELFYLIAIVQSDKVGNQNKHT